MKFGYSKNVVFFISVSVNIKRFTLTNIGIIFKNMNIFFKIFQQLFPQVFHIFVTNYSTAMKKKGKILGWITLILTLALAGFVYFKFYFVFGDGVKAGELNQFMLKGYVFKTYEGRLIQAGFRGGKAGSGASIESYIFDFSVENPAVADSMMRLSGKTVELHYKEYLGALPWRGMQRTVVDRIVSVNSPTAE